MPPTGDGVPRKVAIDEIVAQPERFEDLCALIRGDGADPHLRQNLQKPFFQSLYVVLRGGGRIDRNLFRVREIGRELQREIRIHRARSITNEQRDVGDLERFGRFDQEARAHSLLATDQIVLNRRNGEERRNRGFVFRDAAIAEHDDRTAVVDAVRRFLANARDRTIQRFFRLIIDIVASVEVRGDDRSTKIGEGVSFQLGQIVVRQNRMGELQ